MELEELFDTQRSKIKLVEWRGRIKEDQLNKLKYFDDAHGIPQAAIVRLALECFFPKLTNMNFKEEGIKRLWNENKF